MMKPAPTRPARAGTAAVREAIRLPNGSLPGGSTREAPKGHGRPRVGRSGFSPVAIKQPAVGPWACDHCPTRESGGVKLLAHFEATGHKMFSPR